MRASNNLKGRERTLQVRFKLDAVDKIAAREGLTTEAERAAFFGVRPSNWSRVVNGVTAPGKDFIAAVLASHPEDQRVRWDNLFEIVEVVS